MTFKFEMPISLPRFTTDEYSKAKAEHVAKNGYTINIPGFWDIIKWDVTPEPNEIELALYRAKNVTGLGEKRYNDIHEMMIEKKENFMRLLASPVPEVVQNAGSILTCLDDVNDTLGTLGVVCRIAAQRLPHQIAKLLGGPAFWLFTAADIANIAAELSRMPWKAKRLQHELNRVVRNNPLSKKGRVANISKLKRTNITKGEVIEALQTTDNIFGFGLCLGPIMGMVYDIPAGLYRHVRGETVTIQGMPAPFLWFDRIWARGLRHLAQLWTGIPEIDDRTLGKTMVSLNCCTQMMNSIDAQFRDLGVVPELDSIQIPAPTPYNPSTFDTIKEEVGDVQKFLGWMPDGDKWIDPAHVWNTSRSDILANVKRWYQDNRFDTESMVCNQNAIEAGLNCLALAEGEDAVEWDFEPTAMSTLKLLNVDWRFPPGITTDQRDCFSKQMKAYDDAGLQPDIPSLLQTATKTCGFSFTTKVPARSSVPYKLLSEKYASGIYNLQKWYMRRCLARQTSIFGREGRYTPEYVPLWLKERNEAIQWLTRYGWERHSVLYFVGTWTDTQKTFYGL